MWLLGLITYPLACSLAVMLTARPMSRRTTLAVLAGFLLLIAGPMLVGWSTHDGEITFSGLRPIQLGVIALYALTIALLPSGLLRPFAARKWAPPAAMVLALALPFVNLALFRLFGDPWHPVSDGIGHLGDLLFLDPVEMGEGVTRDGVIPHRFRIHHPALIGMVLVALLLQLLPVLPRCTRSE